MGIKKDYIRENADGTVTITLVKGYVPSGTSSAVQEVTMREPMVRDQQVAQIQGGGDNGEMEVNLLATLIGVSPAEIMTMTSRDYGRLQAGYNFFMD